MSTLWDTTGSDVVAALAAERRSGGAVTSGCALSLVVIVDERSVGDAVRATAAAAAHHPLRLLMVVRREVDAPVPRLDAEVQIGGQLGPCEAVVLRMYGRLALHAESVVLPLLAPDAPVVTWWHTAPPDVIAHDPLGVLADRRITDCSLAGDPVAALVQRGVDYATGDTDLAWTRITPWRAQLAAAFDTVRQRAVAAEVVGPARDPSALLLAGWLRSRMGVAVRMVTAADADVSAVSVRCEDDVTVRVSRSDGHAIAIERVGAPVSAAPLPERHRGDLLAEELRRLDFDQVYAEALGAATHQDGLTERSPNRTHIWRDPALAASEGPAIGEPPAGG